MLLQVVNVENPSKKRKISLNKSPQINIIEEDSEENLNDENKGNNESDLTIDIVEVVIFLTQ